eukprot:CAMPEP_0172508528 /NCGR_PEP_ID=MMETSP1066-20121228/212730_1 /TAXON_ID=671091 /ORGANISM="Coscinodiscus wailesii, Strain CCMP2513" /LENGTH=410 /DNA_ID=CAMNT_0013286539 /DNA_START=168 /DNA_END=1400 /DNA_ORIENTATION=-
MPSPARHRYRRRAKTNDDDDDDGDDDDDDDDSDSTSTSGSSGNSSMSEVSDNDPMSDEQQEAYWIQRTLREAIFGKVRLAVVLRRRPKNINPPPPSNANNAVEGECIPEVEWEVIPGKYCAVKEMSLRRINENRGRMQENPLTEISIMQFIARGGVDGVEQVVDPERFMVEKKVLIPVNVWADNRNLYSILPYANGGELFDHLDTHEKFTEPEARYWMRQILCGLGYLQKVGICHRDISLENLIVHNGTCIIMDYGMSLRVPYLDPTTGRTDARADPTTNQRLLITPQGTCGKWSYMSPEIMKNEEPFDGYAVDMWAAGVILFVMLTGFPPWDRPCRTDDRFRYMTGGLLVELLTQWNCGLSADAMDLLQNMLWFHRENRLTLERVIGHPWVVNGDVTPPDGIQQEQPYV